MRKLRVSNQAARDLDQILEYWEVRVGSQVAERVIRSITKRFTLLVRSPNVGRRRDEIAVGLFTFPAGKYIVYFRKQPGIIRVLRVIHGARDQGPAFAEK